MRVNFKQGEFYIQLPKNIYSKIVKIAEEDVKINLSLLAFLINLILTNRYRNDSIDNWVALNATFLRKYNFKGYTTKYHLEILLEQNIIEKKEYIANKQGFKNISRRYRINPFIHSTQIEQLEYSFESKPLAKKINKRNVERINLAKDKNPKLTEWLLNDEFTFDIDKANEYIANTAFKSDLARDKRIHVAANFYNSISVFSRDGKDDRLHTIFTHMPSDLLKFVRFNNQEFVEADIKSSQPLLATILIDVVVKVINEAIKEKGVYNFKKIERCINKEIVLLFNKRVYSFKDNKEVIKQISNSITTMLQESIETLDFIEIHAFKKLVRDRDIYTNIGNNLLAKNTIKFEDDKFWVQQYDKGEGHIIWGDSKTLRKCGKGIMLNCLYSSPDSSIAAIKEVKKLFLSTFKVLDSAKSKDKTALSNLLQRLESSVVLDTITKRIGRKYPSMPLITRHDSISTTVENKDILLKEMKLELSKILGIEVEVGIEYWRDKTSSSVIEEKRVAV